MIIMKKISLITITLLIALTILSTECLSGGTPKIVRVAQITGLNITTGYTCNSSGSVNVSNKNNAFDGGQVNNEDEECDIVEGWWGDKAKWLWKKVIVPVAVWVWDHWEEIIKRWPW
jgi:hypothetical protein